MAETNVRPKELMVDEKWDRCLDLVLHRSVYGSLAGIAGALLLFRGPSTRLASIAFGAGLGLGSAYTDCSHIFDGHIRKWPMPSPPSPSPNIQSSQSFPDAPTMDSSPTKGDEDVVSSGDER
ncbi:hypothetical protein CBR_g28554 [Chara braunii]|uniref:MICOS complex subunit MIC10 n=1 Tax=Chara braunii TaxID=69332 RepID=A0A388JWD5_CHABU|nr:hypothetical protein CBR_g28554 [Chara braunii]|eukprot:GBG62078.1 hypothetical protein CBR_g28554 [Chara braunii]